MKKQVSVLGKRKLLEEKSTKSLDAILADWQNEAEITEEQKKGRLTAAERIRECANNKSTRLNLSFLKLSSLPAEIFKPLTQLRTLNLSHNQLVTLPEKLFEPLSQLISLSLFGNQLATLPENLFKDLTQLKKLDLQNNQLRILREKLFKELTQLEKLDLGHNEFRSLPKNLFERLIQLKILSLIGNQLATLPENLFKPLTQLEQLYLTGNQLATLPEKLFEPLSQLISLSLAGNQFRTLPENLFKPLTQLEGLDLMGNHLITLPENLFKPLTQLGILHLHSNRLRNLPEKLFEPLTQLRSLDLRDNQLETLPELETFEQLSILYLQNNRFSAVMVESIRSRIRWNTTCYIDIYDPGNRGLQLSDYRFTDLLDLLVQELNKNHLDTHLFKRSVDDLKPLESSMSSFVLFLQKLPMMRDWSKQGSHFQLLKHISMIINAMADSQPIRQQCETIAADSVDTCGDRVALGLIRMSVAVSHFSKSVWSKNSLYEYGKVVSRFETIMALARTKASTMGGAVDEIEVILKYLKELNQPLTLGLPITEMLYEACSGIDDNDIKRALDYVTRAEPMSIHAYLAGFDGTRTVFGDDFDKIENAFDTNQIGDESDADYVKRMTRLPEQLRQARIELLESRYANNVADSASSATAATSEADLDVAGCAEVSEISDSADSATDAYARDDNVNSGGVIESKNSG